MEKINDRVSLACLEDIGYNMIIRERSETNIMKLVVPFLLEGALYNLLMASVVSSAGVLLLWSPVFI